MKLLLYLTPPGFGELDADETIAFSDVREPALRPASVTGAVGEGMRSSVNAVKAGILAELVLGELAMGDTPRGDADNVGVLKGWTENELLRLAAAALREFRELCAATLPGTSGRAGSGVGGELALKSWAFRRADIGSVPVARPA